MYDRLPLSTAHIQGQRIQTGLPSPVTRIGPLHQKTGLFFVW